MSHKKLERSLPSPKEDLDRYARFWRMIARCAYGKRFKAAAMRWWRSLNIGNRLGQRSVESACKFVAKIYKAYMNGDVPFDRRIVDQWPNDDEIYPSDDEEHIPADDFHLCALGGNTLNLSQFYVSK